MYEEPCRATAPAPRPSRRRRHVPGLFRSTRQPVQAVRVLPPRPPDPCRAGDLQTLVGWWVDSDAIWRLDDVALPSGDAITEGFVFVR